MQINADPQEIDKFSALAHRWWDPEGEFAPLHQINPLRLDWIDQHAPLRGKRVLDFAAGSGLVAIAAAKCGAAHVTACEIEAFALDAITLNARANDVTIDAHLGDFVGRDDGWDVVLAGDVSYERDMAERVTRWLQGLHERGATVLIGDPGRAYLARDRLEKIAEHDVPVIRDLEDADVKKTAVWRFK